MAITTLPNLGPDPFTVNAAVLNGKVDPLATDYNGNIDDSNIASGANIANSKLNLTSISQAITMTGGLTISTAALTMSGMPINQAKGADIVSAGTNTTNITTATGNTVHITGTTAITGFVTATAGIKRSLIFDGILTFTHNSTSLILPTGANITTAAGDTAEMFSEGSGNWRCLSYQRKDGTSLVGGYTPTPANALSGSIVQTVRTKVVSYAALGSTAIPGDDTTPLWSEGNTSSALDTTITANSASNELRITVSIPLGISGAATQLFGGVFLDPSGTDAAKFTGSLYCNDTYTQTFEKVWYITPADTSAHTYKFRFGTNGGATISLNGFGGSRQLGGTLQAVVTIEEIKA